MDICMYVYVNINTYGCICLLLVSIWLHTDRADPATLSSSYYDRCSRFSHRNRWRCPNHLAVDTRHDVSLCDCAADGECVVDVVVVEDGGGGGIVAVVLA